MADLPKRIALVYDRVNKWGGAEQVLLNLHELFPQAPLFTAVYDPKNASWADVFPQVYPSFLQRFPWAKSHHEFYPWLTPIAFESLKLTDYDIVISVTSADAKGVVTRPETLHICYCLTPTRYLWVHQPKKLGIIFKPLFNYLKKWDRIASNRPDVFIAISQTVKDRIKKIYNQDSLLISPPVDLDKYYSVTGTGTNRSFFLFIGRLVYHKHPDRLIRLFNELNLPLVIVGSGRLEASLKAKAKPNIKFAGHVSQSQLKDYLKNAKALVSVHEEDFGIAYVEAQAAGVPIIALNQGGVTEIVIHNQTGFLASSLDEMKSVLLNFDSFKFDLEKIKNNALRFSKSLFKSEFVKVLEAQWTKHINTFMS